MDEQAQYNPDILTCLANLSSDEVFTPPNIVNAILDMLPVALWSNPDAKFLDPCTKSGVFLREITRRLVDGLEDAIPDLQKRIDHILGKQVYGLAITELTAMIARRSLYCSKHANEKYSIASCFDNPDGNIIFHKSKHSWKKGKCIYCGASKATYQRDSSLESHAYAFIHDDKKRSFSDMKFDVIIGNPPYQMNDGGGMGSSATPIYHKFVEQAKQLNPCFLVMIIPARWYSGGKGLDEFRDTMLNEKRISHLVDYFDSSISFPGVDVSGGVCYFLWEKNYNGDCRVKNITKSKTTEMKRPLLEAGTQSFIRFNDAVSIVRKIRKQQEPSFSSIVSARKPFGFSNPKPTSETSDSKSVKVYAYPENYRTLKTAVTQNQQIVEECKVFIAKAYGERGMFPYRVLAKPFIGEPKSCCSETYLMIAANNDLNYANNILKYISTRFFRFLVLLRKNTQNAPKGVYQFVPLLDFNEEWTDEKLYKKYKLTKAEIEYISSMVSPMELDS